MLETAPDGSTGQGPAAISLAGFHRNSGFTHKACDSSSIKHGVNTMNLPIAKIAKVLGTSLVGCAALAATLPAIAANPVEKKPFQIHLLGTANNGFFCGVSYTVPAGQHIHVSYVAFRGASSLSGQITTGGEFNVSLPLFQTYMNPLQGNYSPIFSETLFTGGQEIVAEADPGAVIGVGYYFAQIDGSLSCEVGLSGHLETAL